ncbi:MAG: heavy-metal-associated domain-containing protein, partial [Thermofilaceae archaeon]
MKIEEKIKIIGVDCPTCVLSIERELQKLGIEIKADLTSGYATVKYSSSSVTLRDVGRAVREAGYDLEKRSLIISVNLSGEEVPRFESNVTKLKGIIECRYSPVTGLAKIAYNPYSTTGPIFPIRTFIYLFLSCFLDGSWRGLVIDIHFQRGLLNYMRVAERLRT